MWKFLNILVFFLAHLCVLCSGFRLNFSAGHVFNCEGNGYNLDSRTSHCYKFHKHIETWRDASAFCRAEGARLAVVNSDIEKLVLMQLFSLYPPERIIGVTNDETSMNFVAIGIYYSRKAGWMTVNGRTLWEAGYPQWYNGLTRPYGVMRRNGQHSNIAPHLQQPFICEKAPA